ncbi:ABC transporter substrate-binding protein [Streptomyces blattellae]|uniref:ABC transporter substrate-binding protein n=1 Tax=Streptomyces blattellae TaxID=2569855 RepID=UPI0012B73CED|nr:ABC transporter substrate-binding protein [Streptomyces blattellae]
MTSDPTPVRFAGGAQGFNWLPVFVADELGLFRKHGLEIEYLRLGSVDKATSAVRDGAADLAITPPEGAVADYVAGGALRIVAANSLRLPMSLVARPEVGSVAELRGKRIGTSSLTEGTALYTQIMLQREGLSYPDDYGFVLAGVHTTRWAALQKDEIDCAPQPAPWNFLAEREGYRLIGEVNDAIPEVVFAAVIGRNDWTAQNRDTVERLIAALAEAHDIVNDPTRDDITLPVYQRITTPDAPDLAARGLPYTRDMGMWPKGLAVTPAAWAATADLMVRAGLLDPERVADAAGVLDTGFVRGD